MTITIATVSDIHGMWSTERTSKILSYFGNDPKIKIDYPKADILILAGDILRNYSWDRQFDALKQLEELTQLNQLFGELKKDKYKEIIVVGGNHDFAFELQSKEAARLLTNAIYLMDSSATVQGIKFWGSPRTPFFHNWAYNFNKDPEKYKIEAMHCWNSIPNDIQVLITHGPPYDILDKVDPARSSQERVGCKYLLNRIKQLNLKLHVFGHIHYSRGILKKDNTLFVNAAICNEDYLPLNPIQVVTID